MIKFSKEKVLLLHRLIAEETGGSIGVRYETLLESALENVFSGFGGKRALGWAMRSSLTTPSWMATSASVCM